MHNQCLVSRWCKHRHRLRCEPTGPLRLWSRWAACQMGRFCSRNKQGPALRASDGTLFLASNPGWKGLCLLESCRVQAEGAATTPNIARGMRTWESRETAKKHSCPEKTHCHLHSILDSQASPQPSTKEGSGDPVPMSRKEGDLAVLGEHRPLPAVASILVKGRTRKRRRGTRRMYPVKGSGCAGAGRCRGQRAAIWDGCPGNGLITDGTRQKLDTLAPSVSPLPTVSRVQPAEAHSHAQARSAPRSLQSLHRPDSLDRKSCRKTSGRAAQSVRPTPPGVPRLRAAVGQGPDNVLLLPPCNFCPQHLGITPSFDPNPMTGVGQEDGVSVHLVLSLPPN